MGAKLPAWRGRGRPTAVLTCRRQSELEWWFQAVDLVAGPNRTQSHAVKAEGSALETEPLNVDSALRRWFGEKVSGLAISVKSTALCFLDA